MTRRLKPIVRELGAFSGLFSLILFSAQPAFAESAENDLYTEAQAGLANAYSDYYRELRKRPGFTPEQAKEVADRILSPANAKVAHALEEDFKRTYKNGGAAEAASDDSKRKPASGKPGNPGAAESKEAVEEIVIDGSSVPAEVEFPGKPKAAVPAPIAPQAKPQLKTQKK